MIAGYNNSFWGRMPHRLACITPALCGLAVLATAEPIRVASLNPVVSDLARQVGGEHVEVIDLMPIGANPHRFYPTPTHLKQASTSILVLAAGKGLESFLEEFRESLGADVPVMEVGDAVPSLTLKSKDVFVCCPSHAHDVVDPHWWHSVVNARRAASAIADRFAEADPEHTDDYARRAREYGKTLEALHGWARKQIAAIPRQDRELTTAHAAYGYFCREFGLRSITVQGLTTEENPEPDYLKKVIATLRSDHVRAVFPELGANPSVLASMVEETGVIVGGALYANAPPPDNPTYEAMVRHNVRTIVDTLTGKH